MVHTLGFSTRWGALYTLWGTRDGCRPLFKSTPPVRVADTATPSLSCTHSTEDNTSCATHCPLIQMSPWTEWLWHYWISTQAGQASGQAGRLTAAGIYCSLLGREVSHSRILQLCLQLQDRWRILRKCFEEAKFRSLPFPSHTLDKLTSIYCLPPLVSS